MVSIYPNQVPQVVEWLAEGGLAHWTSLDLSNPGREWLTANGDLNFKPHWAAAPLPEVITDPAQVVVLDLAEVGRFHVAVRRGSQGLSWKLTDASSRKVRAAVKRAEAKHPHAEYRFDYMTQEAVILAGEGYPLPAWQERERVR